MSLTTLITDAKSELEDAVDDYASALMAGNDPKAAGGVLCSTVATVCSNLQHDVAAVMDSSSEGSGEEVGGP